MLTLKIVAPDGFVKGEYKGMDIKAEYNGELAAGDKLKVSLDGCNFIAIKLDERVSESIVYVPSKSFEYVIPNGWQLGCGYPKGTFTGDKHIICVREPEDEEVYGYRNLALNPYDAHGKTRYFPHATANFVTREDPAFYERNAIDGVIDVQGHGPFPYHSWAGGARNDLEYFLDFGREVEIDKLVFYLRSDFRHDDMTGLPHDSYWKNIDIEFSDGEIIHGEFTLDNTDLNPANSIGQEVTFEKKVTRSIRLLNFVQATEILSFAALSQLEVYGTIIKEDLSKM